MSILGRGRRRPDAGRAALSTSTSASPMARPASRTVRPTTPSNPAVAWWRATSSSVTKSLECARRRRALRAGDPGRGRLSRPAASPRTLDTDTVLVFVIDVIAVYLGKADGINQLPQDGMPTVVTAPTARPGITVPDGDRGTRRAARRDDQGRRAARPSRMATPPWCTSALGPGPRRATPWPRGRQPLAAPADRRWSSTEDATAIGSAGRPAGRRGAARRRQGRLANCSSSSRRRRVPGRPAVGVDPASTLIFVIDVLGIQK